MPEINRSLIIVKAKQPFLDWAHSIDPEDDSDLDGGRLAVLLIAAGGAIAAVFYAITHNNDINLGGTVVVVSPTK